MDFENSKNRIVALIVIISTSIFLLLLDSVGVVDSLYDLTSLLSVPTRIELRRFTETVNNFTGALSRISTLSDENQDLREENEKLLEEISELKEYKNNNESLKEQLKLKQSVRDWIIEGRVIGSNLTYEASMQIDLGTYDGVAEGDIVVYGKYAIGKIIRAGKYVSKVQLITSPTSNIPAKGQVNNARGLINGDVGLSLKMTDILPNEKIDQGELIVTSGVESKYPAGLILGTVEEVKDNPAFAVLEATVNVQMDFSKLDYIYVIKGQNQ